MPQNFIAPDRDQLMLMPVDVRDWLPDDDLVWTVLDVVDELDLTAFRARYRVNGQGAAAFDPAMMVALVIYAHAVGVRSSRSMERACTRDAGFKVVTGQLVPDHSTITRFLKVHQQALGGLFGQVLALCHAMGMVQLGVIAVDGTKVAANASWAKSFTDAGLAHQLAEQQAGYEALAAQLLDGQLATDEAEDEAFGVDRRGDELPEALRRREQRIAKIKAAQADLAERDRAAREAMLAEQRAKQADYDAKAAAGSRPAGRRPKDEVKYGPVPSRSKEPPRASVVDPDSRRMKTTRGGFVQGYNAQFAVTAEQVIVAAKASQVPTDHHQFAEVVDLVEQTLAEAGITEELDTVLADAGYANEETFADAEDRELVLLAPLSSDKKRVAGPAQTWDPADGKDLSELPATDRAQARLREPAGADLYALRGRTVEPVIGQLKDRRGLRQFTRRGLAAVNAEITLAATVHNLCKYHTKRQAARTDRDG